MDNDNKRIAKNTIINYAGLIIRTVLGIFISRFVLQALGASDYGLYGVVAGLITMLNVISTAMHTTTRRYVNVEMGKKNGNPNRIFNICLVVHLGFALFILLIAETIGIWYINSLLNVDPGKLPDAMFVFQVSTIAAAVGIINVPYQAVMEAYERFDQMVGLGIFNLVLQLVFVYWLLFYDGEVLRVYAAGISGLTLVSFVFYHLACKLQWPEVIRHKYYHDKALYKEILFFNNYSAIGAFAYCGKIQGSQMIINYFFGTIVNSAFAIAYMIENYCTLIVNSLGQAAAPQITQSFAGGKMERTNALVEAMSRYSILLTLIIVVPLSFELDFILDLWLVKVPEGAVLLCQLTLIDALVNAYCGGTNTLVQATGRVKWFQIVGSGTTIMVIPVAILFFSLGLPQESIIILYIISSLIIRIFSFYLLHRYIDFDIMHYVRHVYGSTTVIVVIMIALYCAYHTVLPSVRSMGIHFLGLIASSLIIIALCATIGLNKTERETVLSILRNIKHKH